MDKFSRELQKELYRKLPQSDEYSWSSRIEGALERNEVPGYHEFVAIIVDNEIPEEDLRSLTEKLFRFIRTDNYFRHSKYRVILWKEGKFQKASQVNISIKNHIKQALDDIKPGGSPSGDWDNFRELYTPHKKAGQVILLSSSRRVESLRQQEQIRARNLLILYCGDSETMVKETIASIPCIALLTDDESIEK